MGFWSRMGLGFLGFFLGGVVAFFGGFVFVGLLVFLGGLFVCLFLREHTSFKWEK